MKDNPTSQAGEPACAPLPSPTTPLQRILVADDDSDIRRLNAEVLKNSGYEVDTAEDGEVALHIVSDASVIYDLLITDGNMPKLSGLDLVKKLRAERMTLPVIIATGTLPKQEFTKHTWLRPAAILLKPYTIDELLGTVREVLYATDSAYAQIKLLPDWRGQS